MSCEMCPIPIGSNCNISVGQWCCCTRCSYNIKKFFPTNGDYEGLFGENHVFILDNPIQCPSCFMMIIRVSVPCGNVDGGSVELPLILELPVIGVER